MTFFEMNKITFGYDSSSDKTIHNFSLSIQQGEIVGILGKSGSGKSTLLRLIAGLEAPSQGSIIIDGKTVVDERAFVEPEERGVGMVFQDYALFPHLSVTKNILFGLHKIPHTERQRRLEEMLELVHLQGFEKRYPHELSGGQQQRVALARALAPRPKILLMDEPFSNLDADLKEKIRVELKQILKSAQMTCIFVTHDKEDVKAICDRSVIMDSY
jgi:iron(III) transport system ATP-binding protein